MRWLFVVARAFVPSGWRESVVRDLQEEAAEQQHGQVWLVWQTLRAAARLRLAFGGDGVVSDVRMVTRSLVRAKGFTTAAVLTFTLGIGANIAVFSVIDRLMFRPLPYAEPARLIHIYNARYPDPTSPFAGLPGEITAHIAASARSISSIGWMDFVRVTAPIDNEAPLRLMGVTSNSLDVLGVRPVLGRAFTTDDAILQPQAETAVVLTHAAWRNRFGGSFDVIARSWGTTPVYRVIGVLPPGFVLPSSQLIERVDGLCVLSEADIARGTSPGVQTTGPFARLSPGATVAIAQAELDALIAQPAWASSDLREQLAANPAPLTVQPLREGMTLFVRPYLWLISGAVWIVLCVACVNLTTLLLARGRSRQRDAAIRATVGASPARLIRLALIESSVLCVASSVIAITVCSWAEASLMALVPPALGAFAVPPLDARIIAITTGVAFVSAAIAGTLPAVSLTRFDLLAVLHRTGRAARHSSPRGGSSLLALQAAFGVALVTGGAMVVPPFVSVVMQSPGFESRDLFILSVSHGAPSDLSAPDVDRRERVSTILDVIRHSPRVEHAAAALTLPFGGGSGEREFWQARGLTGQVLAISEGLFDTLRTPVREGRAFSREDVDAEAPIAVISEHGARALWPGARLENALNQRIEIDGITRVVIGVVADVRTTPPAPAQPILYVPISAQEQRLRQRGLRVAARMAPGATPDRREITEGLNERIVPRGGVTVRSVAAELAPMLDRPRLLAVLMGGLAGIALLLVGVGLYALASFEVTRRRYDIGVRLALGSSVSAIRRRILRFAVVPVLIGTVVGGLAVWWVGNVAHAKITEVDAHDPWAYAGATLLMLIVATLGAALPAFRAGRVDPVAVVRES